MDSYKLKSFLQFVIEEQSGLNGNTHSIIDGLNRGKNSLLNNQSQIHAKIIHEKDLNPLSPDEIDQHDRAAEAARKKGDYFTGSTFGNEKNRYSVQQALDHAKTVPTQKIPTSGFVTQQVNDHWQGNIERAKKAIPSEQHPILIMKHKEL